MFVGDAKGIVTYFRDAKTISERWLHFDLDWPTGFDRRGIAWRAFGLNPDDLHGRLELLLRDNDAGDQASAADGNDDGVQVRHLRRDLQRHCPLPRNDRWIVVAVDVSEPLFAGDFLRLCTRFPDVRAVK